MYGVAEPATWPALCIHTLAKSAVTLFWDSGILGFWDSFLDSGFWDPGILDSGLNVSERPRPRGRGLDFSVRPAEPSLFLSQSNWRSIWPEEATFLEKCGPPCRREAMSDRTGLRMKQRMSATWPTSVHRLPIDPGPPRGLMPKTVSEQAHVRLFLPLSARAASCA